MAKLILTSRFGDIAADTGLLLQGGPGTTILERSATVYEYAHADTGSALDGLRVRLTGTAFSFNVNDRPIGGRIAKLQILTAEGATIAAFADLGPRGPANSLIGFHDHAFRGADWGGATAWDYMMAAVYSIAGTNRDDRFDFAVAFDGMSRHDMRGGDDVLHLGTRPWSGYLDGGSGTDTLSYAGFTGSNLYDAAKGLAVAMEAPGRGTAEVMWQIHDSFTGFEILIATRLDDSFQGSKGNDTVAGLRGADTLDGGAGAGDRLIYGKDAGYGGTLGIRVDLAGGKGRPADEGRIVDGFGTVDVVRGFEQVHGTRFDDRFFGAAGDETFAGGAGTDVFDGRAGFDTVDFGAIVGGDTSGAVHLDLRRATGQVIDDGFGNTETLRRIEGVVGGAGDDTLRGNAGDQVFDGGAGRDLLAGHGGQDTFVWHSAPDPGEIDRIADFRSRGAADQVDRIRLSIDGFEAMRNMLVLVNGPAARDPIGTLLFDRATETLFWDRDGTGPAAPEAIIVLEGVRLLTPMNLDLVF